ncbi:MAG: 30S ribosomal protein S17 [Candidatus Absconditabacteria bacterium]|nr:30S ribosomal protein S17 [Candidatus Absconditabacteria bacterium]
MAIIGNKNIKELIGEVISDKTDKTRIVLVKTVKVHPLYRKRFIVRKKYYVHDEQNVSKIGDMIKFREVKPVSKLKRWSLVEKTS